MKLSIIVPAYNEESTIEELISKVRAASLPEGISREIVIVNDGSKDRTADILSRFSGQAPPVAVLMPDTHRSSEYFCRLLRFTACIAIAIGHSRHTSCKTLQTFGKKFLNVPNT